MSNKNKPVAAAVPVKNISTTKPAVPTPIDATQVEAVKHIPRVPKVNAGNVEYDDDKVNEVLANFEKLAAEAETKEKKTKVRDPNRNIARNIVAKLFPHIKVLIEKGYNKKEMYKIFTAQGIAINFAGFSSAINKKIKAEAEAEAAAQKIVLELEATTEEPKPELTGEGGEPTPEELAAEAELAEGYTEI